MDNIDNYINNQVIRLGEKQLKYVQNVIKKPCMNEKCEEFIINYIKENNVKSILEFGSGNSTCMFSSLGCVVITVEHDIVYFKVISDLLYTERVMPVLATRAVSYLVMAKLIDDVDLIFVDGELRQEILTIILNSDKEWKTVFVHDAEREELFPFFEKFKKRGHKIIKTDTNLFVCERKE